MIFSVFFHSNAEFGGLPATFDNTARALDTEQLLLREGLQGPGPAREDHRRLRHGVSAFFLGGEMVSLYHMNKMTIWGFWATLLITFRSWLSRLGVARFWAKHAKAQAKRFNQLLPNLYQSLGHLPSNLGPVNDLVSFAVLTAWQVRVIECIPPHDPHGMSPYFVTWATNRASVNWFRHLRINLSKMPSMWISSSQT